MTHRRLHLSIILLLPLLFVCVLFATPSRSQNTGDTTDIENIWNLVTALSKQAQQVQKELNDAMKQPSTSSGTRHREELQNQLDQLNKNFESLATKLSTDDLIFGEEVKEDWTKELQELTSPLLQAVRELTKKPRRIEKLKKQIDLLETQQAKYEDAFTKVTSLLERAAKETSKDPGTLAIASRLNELKNKYDPELIRLKLDDARLNLKNELSDKKSLVDIARESIKDFFKHRGRNLLVTLATFFGLLWGLFRFRGWVIGKHYILKLQSRTRKLLRVGFNLFTIIICTTGSLLSLYLLNDWLLLSVIIIVLVAIGWTSRQLIPKVFQEVQMSLNMGTVREHERLIWNGVPWMVKSLGLEATLVNEQLDEGVIQLPLKELIGKYSRQVVENEPWFPSKTGDWVILADSTYGQVKHQTQEQVTLQLLGNSSKYYPTGQYLKLSPVNISHGFLYNITFGLNYGIQSRICDEIPKLFENGLRKYLDNHFQEKSPDFLDLKVQFDNASVNSLYLAVLINVDGRCAEMYDCYKREINCALVRICNENKLNMLFNQLTVNFSDGAQIAGVTTKQP